VNTVEDKIKSTFTGTVESFNEKNLKIRYVTGVVDGEEMTKQQIKYIPAVKFVYIPVPEDKTDGKPCLDSSGIGMYEFLEK
jgi:hypothetical protein